MYNLAELTSGAVPSRTAHCRAAAAGSTSSNTCTNPAIGLETGRAAPGRRGGRRVAWALSSEPPAAARRGREQGGEPAPS